MAIFGFFSKKNETKKGITVPMTPIMDSSTDIDDVSKGNNVTQELKLEPKGNTPLMVSCATGWPIDIIYGYLNKNYEEKGYNDAMIKCDLAFRDMNKNIIRNKILMIFREINLNYNAMQQDLETRINNCNAAGLLTTVAELDKQMSVIKSHKEELANLEEDFKNNINEASIPLQSYECGFLRGVATIAMSVPQQQNFSTKIQTAPTLKAMVG